MEWLSTCTTCYRANRQMTTLELNEFSRILDNRRSELQTRGRSRDVLSVESTPDELDRIQQASDHDFEVGNLQRSQSQLREVQGAIRRIRDGVFGICAECEEEIGPKRLRALPWAPRCIACQEAEDLDGGSSHEEFDEPQDLAA
jgi:DnaK suppressor protein